MVIITYASMCLKMFDEVFQSIRDFAFTEEVSTSNNLLCLHFSAELPQVKTWIYFMFPLISVILR